MAGDWIKFEKTTIDKPEVFEMAGILGIDPDAVVGKLIRVWNWFDDQSRDGHANVTVMSLLDRYSGVTGFVEAMAAVGWMQIDGNAMVIPNFNRHNGETAKNRSLAKNRKEKQRSNVTQESRLDRDIPVTKVGPEKRREEKKNIRMAKPSFDEISEYGKTLDPPFRKADAFLAFYDSNGWLVGKNPMKDWKAAVRTWQQKDKTTTPTKQRSITEEFSYQKNGTSTHRPLWD